MIQDHTTRANVYLSTTCVNTVLSYMSCLGGEKCLFSYFSCYPVFTNFLFSDHWFMYNSVCLKGIYGHVKRHLTGYWRPLTGL